MGAAEDAALLLHAVADDAAAAVGAHRREAWMAHSKLSNVCEAPRTVTWNALSYSFPHTSQEAGIWTSF